MKITGANIRISQKKTVGQLVAVTASLALMGGMVEIISGAQRNNRSLWLKVFDLDTEWNIPTIYSAILLLSVAILARLIAINIKGRNSRLHLFWLLAAIFLLFMAVDELTGIHNRAAYFVPQSVRTIDVFRFRWIVVGLATVTLLALVSLPFLWVLPSRTRKLLLFSVAIYLGGALGMEMVAAALSAQEGEIVSWAYSTSVVVEETMEMSGILMFLVAQFGYIRQEFDGRLHWRSFDLYLRD